MIMSEIVKKFIDSIRGMLSKPEEKVSLSENYAGRSRMGDVYDMPGDQAPLVHKEKEV